MEMNICMAGRRGMMISPEQKPDVHCSDDFMLVRQREAVPHSNNRMDKIARTRLSFPLSTIGMALNE